MGTVTSVQLYDDAYLRSVLDRAQNGEEVTITRYGDPACKLTGIAPLPSPEPTPTPDPTTADPLLVPGTGQVLFQDLCTAVDASTVGWAYTDPYRLDFRGIKPDASKNPYNIRTPGSSPWPAPGKTSLSAYHRDLIYKAGVISLYDKGGSDSRTQLEKGYKYANGSTTITYVDFMLEKPNPLPNGANGGGNKEQSQLLQLKEWGSDPFLVVYQGNDGIRLTFGSTMQEKQTLAVGVWHRLALKTKWSSTGYVELWGSWAEAGKMTKVESRSLNLAIGSGGTYYCIGPYHYVSLLPSKDLHTRYANMTVCAA